MIDQDVLDIQRLYPQIYLACHRAHVRSATTSWQLSSHDAAILAHLDRDVGLPPSVLAAHLGVGASTLSASLKRLADLGYLVNRIAAADRRRRELLLTSQGLEAMAGTSVLDAERVRSVLRSLTDEERGSVLLGLQLFARATRRVAVDRCASC